MNINCINNKIANSKSALKPIILQAIRNLYLNSNHQMTARMVKNQCIILDANISWEQKNPAICNSMRNSIECGGRIIGEDRDFNDFTIAFDVNGNNLDIPTPKSKSTIKKKKATSQPKKTNDMSITNQEELILSKKFKVVMVCAGGKNNSFFTAYPHDNFVNEPNQPNEHHPDETMDNKKKSWRDYLITNQSDINLKKAFELYNPTKTKYPYVYLDLFSKYKTNFFILSAGWGLVNSEYRLPNYDITFSTRKTVPRNTRRKKNITDAPIYHDFNQFIDESKNLLINPEEDILYIGGKDYLKLFYALTQNMPNRKIIYYKGLFPTDLPVNSQNFIFREYYHSIPTTDTNWHYELAYKISNGIIP